MCSVVTEHVYPSTDYYEFAIWTAIHVWIVMHVYLSLALFSDTTGFEGKISDSYNATAVDDAMCRSSMH